ncbi:MAG: hypothetical protein GY853_14510 [PVC group bacterium]|nr:hypothetical protein [PVC group bacterium]
MVTREKAKIYNNMKEFYAMEKEVLKKQYDKEMNRALAFPQMTEPLHKLIGISNQINLIDDMQTRFFSDEAGV